MLRPGCHISAVKDSDTKTESKQRSQNEADALPHADTGTHIYAHASLSHTIPNPHMYHLHKPHEFRTYTSGLFTILCLCSYTAAEPATKCRPGAGVLQ